MTITSLDAANRRVDELEGQLHAARKVAIEHLTRAERAEERMLALEMSRDSLLELVRLCLVDSRLDLPVPYRPTDPAAPYEAFGG